MRTSRRTPVACGVDVGSTNLKVVLLDRDGSVVSRASRPTPRDADALCMEGEALLSAVASLLLEACSDRFEVHGLCSAGVGEDGVLVDAGLRPLTPALAWFDPRRRGILRELRAEIESDDSFDVPDDADRTFVGWRWARQRTGSAVPASWVAAADLPAVQWSGRVFLSDTLASRTAAWRARDRSWDADRVGATLGSTSLLPPVLAGGEFVGELRSAPLLAAGAVAGDAIVVAGGHDHPVGGWAVDRMSPGDILDSMGTAEVVVAQSPLPPERRTPDVDVAPGIASAGSTLLYVVELARNVSWASQDPDVAAAIDALLNGRVAPASALHERFFWPGLRGGVAPAYALDAPRSPLERAAGVLGALARLGREGVDAVRESMQGRGDIWGAGGWVRSPGWLSIKEAVGDHRIEPIPEPEVTAVGAALLAATALGWDADPAVALGVQPVTRP